MPKPEADLTLSPLVAELYELDAQITALESAKAAKEAELIELGDGTYIEPNGKRTAVVITPAAPKPTYTLYPDAAKKAFCEAKDVKKATPELLKEFASTQEETARALAGISFGTLFDRTVLYTPAKGFADMVPRLFKTSTVKAKKLLLLCQVTKAAGRTHVKLPQKPKPSEDEEEA